MRKQFGHYENSDEIRKNGVDGRQSFRRSLSERIVNFHLFEKRENRYKQKNYRDNERYEFHLFPKMNERASPTAVQTREERRDGRKITAGAAEEKV